LKTIRFNEDNGKIRVLKTKRLKEKKCIIYSIQGKYFRVNNLKLYINSLDKKNMLCDSA